MSFLLIFYNFFDVSGSNLRGSIEPPEPPLDPPQDEYFEEAVTEVSGGIRSYL